MRSRHRALPAWLRWYPFDAPPPRQVPAGAEEDLADRHPGGRRSTSWPSAGRSVREKNAGLYRLPAVCKPGRYRLPDDLAWSRSSRRGGSMMIRRSAIFVALLASTAALAVPALASGASTEAKVTVGSPPTPYLPN